MTPTPDAPIYDAVCERLRSTSRRWVVTGAAGFIGSHLVERLLSIDQEVVGLDNFSTGSKANLEAVRGLVSPRAWARFRQVEGDIRDPACLDDACRGAHVVLHQAALGSVPRSMADPVATTSNNVDGTVAVFVAAKRANVRRVVYASSSSVYGDDLGLPKREDRLGRPLSPYALSKRTGELYADLFQRAFDLELLGLRYFNVFGPRQDPDGAYAAVIPRWFKQLVRGQAVDIYGDGETSRDFCYVANVVQANLLAACSESPAAAGSVFNIACGSKTSLKQLYSLIRAEVPADQPAAVSPRHLPFRPGDVTHSLADIDRARTVLGYRPTHDVAQGLHAAAEWYCRQAR